MLSREGIVVWPNSQLGRWVFMGQVECDYRVAKIWEIFPSQINLGRGGNEARSQRILDEIASKFQQRWFIIKYTQNPPPLIRLAGSDCAPAFGQDRGIDIGWRIPSSLSQSIAMPIVSCLPRILHVIISLVHLFWVRCICKNLHCGPIFWYIRPPVYNRYREEKEMIAERRRGTEDKKN